jgi:hypothetical protein
MIEIRRLSDGLSFKILHESGHESEDYEPEALLLSPSQSVPWLAALEFDEGATAGIDRMKDKQFPSISEVDLQHLPEQYRLVPDPLSPDFEFNAGEAFAVFVIGQEMAEVVVIAE